MNSIYPIVSLSMSDYIQLEKSYQFIQHWKIALAQLIGDTPEFQPILKELNEIH